MLKIMLPKSGGSFPKVVTFGTKPKRNVRILTPQAYRHVVKAKKASDEGDEGTYDKEIHLAADAELKGAALLHKEGDA